MAEGDRYEVIIVGAGIAGVALAYFLAERGLTDVVILEREDQPGAHATGRSAETLMELDANETVRALKVLGGKFLRAPPAGFSVHPIMDPTGALLLFRGDHWARRRQSVPQLNAEGIRTEELTATEAHHKVPALNPDQFDGALWLPENGMLDVHELLSSYLKHARGQGVELRCHCEVLGLVGQAGRCEGVRTAQGVIEARWVVNAAGAWAGALAELGRASALPIEPRRRCAVVFPAPDGLAVHFWPLVCFDQERFYFRPMGSDVLFCPMDEQVSEPCDAQPCPEAIATGFERLRRVAPRLVPPALKRSWAGLRTFAPDTAPVVGEDPRLKGFFWLAGQGGWGIETSSALGQIATDLLTDGKSERFDVGRLAPERL
ncbi:MAG: FAD-binding oxidoreductase [Deltaproteobacteria bacterium]|nr:FAD-binding oxidoreductase [Deltaproteobacteria bacterium]